MGCTLDFLEKSVFLKHPTVPILLYCNSNRSLTLQVADDGYDVVVDDDDDEFELKPSDTNRRKLKRKKLGGLSPWQ